MQRGTRQEPSENFHVNGQVAVPWETCGNLADLGAAVGCLTLPKESVQAKRCRTYAALLDGKFVTQGTTASATRGSW